MDELFDSVSRPSNLLCHWQVGCRLSGLQILLNGYLLSVWHDAWRHWCYVKLKFVKLLASYGIKTKKRRTTHNKIFHC